MIQCIWYEGRFQFCHMHVVKPYAIKNYITKKLAADWLDQIKEQEKFNWTFDKDYSNNKLIHIELSDYTHGYRTMIGSLIKGIGEHHEWCLRHMEDRSKDPFFVKSMRAFDAHCEAGDTRNFCTPHIWWEYKMNGLGGQYKRTYNPKTKTIEELFDAYRKQPSNTNVWRNYLLKVSK